MGVINPTNLMGFRSSEPMIARIKKRLSKMDADGLIDDGDFHKCIKRVLKSELGVAVLKECEAVLPVKDYRAKLPDNFDQFHMAIRCNFKFGKTKSINEQRPYIYYHDTELTQDCPDKCTINCSPDYGRTKIVIRTFVNGEENTCSSSNNCLLKLGGSSRELFSEDSPNIGCESDDLITVEDGYINTHFDTGSIYIQYFGLAVDQYGLPMIPDNESAELALEHYIYAYLFEEWYLNSTIPDVVGKLQYAQQQYGIYIEKAKSYVKLPSFAKCIDSIRRQRRRLKFYQNS